MMKIPIIVGPTAIGKTSLSIKLAKELNCKILSIDSMQIYKDMNILSAKVTKDEQEGIEHFGIDIVETKDIFSVADYVKYANEIIEKEKGNIVIVGGTGLYVNSLISGIDFEKENIDDSKLEKYREKLENDLNQSSLEQMYKKAEKIDPIAVSKISENDKKRIFRILEIHHFLGINKTQLETRREKNKKNKYEFEIFMLDDDREKLYDRINTRVLKMIDDGLLDEVKSIYEKMEVSNTSFQAIGYKEVVEYLEKKVSFEEMVDNLQKATRHYAKRQFTWFKKNKPNILDRQKLTEVEMVKKILEKIGG